MLGLVPGDALSADAISVATGASDGLRATPSLTTLSFANARRPCEVNEQDLHDLTRRCQLCRALLEVQVSQGLAESGLEYDRAVHLWIVEVSDVEHQASIVVLTNHLELEATTITAIYKGRGDGRRSSERARTPRRFRFGRVGSQYGRGSACKSLSGGLVAIEPGGHVVAETIHMQGFVAMARQSVRHAAQIITGGPDGVAYGKFGQQTVYVNAIRGQA